MTSTYSVYNRQYQSFSPFVSTDWADWQNTFEDFLENHILEYGKEKPIKIRYLYGVARFFS